MKKLLLLFAVLFTCTTTYAQLNYTYEKRLNDVFDSVCNKYNIKGATASIVVPKEGIWERAHGVSHENVPINTKMYMGIGSNTKTYTAVTLLLLQEKGLLDLDDTIGKWIAPHPNISGSITIRQLLNHTSGLYSFTNNSDLNNMILPNFFKKWPADSVLRLVEPPVSTPGGSWDYCNTNYTLAGLIIRAVTSKPTHKVMRDELLTPHSLNETFYFPDETPQANLIPHAWSNVLGSGNSMEDMIATHNYSHNAFLSIANAAGGMMTTAKDNATFWHKLVSGQILNKASMKELETLVPISIGQGYGLGIFKLSGFNGRPVISHGGTGFGFINENIADQTNNVSITVLTNQDSISNNILLGSLIRALHKVTIRYTDVNDAQALASGIKVYPNPASNTLNINLERSANSTLQLFDISGRLVSNQNLKKGNNQINISNLNSGTYFISISNKNMLLQKQTIQIVK